MQHDMTLTTFCALRLATISLILVAACTDPTAQDAAQVTTRDSAGVSIVEYSRAAVAALPVWQLGEVLTVLGGEDADENHDMTAVVGGLLSDSGFVVADKVNMQLRQFSASGQLRAVSGGRGNGPGQMVSLTNILRTPAGLVAMDFSRGVLVVFDDSLRLRREVSSREFEGGVRYGVFGVERDGTIYARGGPRRGHPLTPQPSDIRRETEVVERLHPGSGRVDSLFTTLGMEYYHLDTGMRVRRFGMRSFVHRTSDGFVTGEGERWEIIGPDSTGTIRRVIRLDWPRRSVTEAMRTEQLRLDHMEIDALPPGGFVGIRRIAALDFADPRFPDSLPPFDRSSLGRDGTLWLREGSAPTDSLHRWFIFRDDSLLGMLALPSGLEVLDAERDRILLRRTDSLDLGYLELREVLPR
jgi:hypothetical protein